MGQAKRRKELGDYPTVKPKPRAETKLRSLYPKELTEMQLASSLLGSSAMFQMRSEIARANREVKG